jgi:pimeloyl-[acyl-carrier protein] synthase
MNPSISSSQPAKAPLSLYHLLDPEVLANPYPLYQRLREHDPVYWDPYIHAWIVTGYDDVVTVLQRFSAARTPSPQFFEILGAPEVAPVAKVMVKQMLFMDPPGHTRLRKLAGLFFTPARVRLLHDHVLDIATKLLDNVIARGTGKIELLSDFAELLPAIVTTEMIGLPSEDHVRLKVWSETFAEILGNFQHNPDRLTEVLRAIEGFSDYFREAMRRERAHPSQGLLNAFMTAEVDGDRLTDDEVVANCIITVVGGSETSTNLITSGILTLLRRPEQFQRMRDDPRIMPAALEELLRFESPVQHTARLATDDVVLGGKKIAKRQAVMAVIAAANRDPSRFPNPDKLDFDRTDNRHLAFGWGAHYCFGAPLARLEGQIGFETLMARFSDLELEGGPLAWRENHGLRGLLALPLRYKVKS